MLTAASFCAATLVVSLFATHLSPIFYGVGVWTGSVIGFVTAYIRLRWLEKHLDEHIFCRGNIMKQSKGIKPPAKVFDASKAAQKVETETGE